MTILDRTRLIGRLTLLFKFRCIILQNIYKHHSVFFNTCIDLLLTNISGNYVDCTFGYGGHSKLILKKLGSKGHLFAFDKDPIVFTTLDSLFYLDKRFHFFSQSFSLLVQILKGFNLYGKIDGILLDLGISSMQIDESNRGFTSPD